MINKPLNKDYYYLLKVIGINKLETTFCDYFNNSDNIHDIFTYFDDNTNIFKKNEAVLVGFNGTQINFDKKIKGKWQHVLGIGGFIFGNHNAFRWLEFLNKCNRLEVDSKEIWGLGKYSKQGSICFRMGIIVKRLMNKYKVD